MTDTSSQIIEKAKSLGFVGAGFSLPQRPPHYDDFRSWLSARHNAGMSWMERNLEIRENPSLLLKDCRVILSLAYPHSSRKPGTPDGFSAARYSAPDLKDYHERLRILCHDLANGIKDACRGSRTRVCVDSAPILERSFAFRSGLGFIGKNNMFIIPGFGSYLYLCEILTTAPLDFAPSEPVEDMCGSCSLCVDSCPTGSLEGPYRLDASRCLSYLTVECREPVSEEQGRKMGDCFFGCDRCQEVCPMNGRGNPRNITLPSTGDILAMDGGCFEERFGDTALGRAGLEKIKANIRALTG